MKAIRKQVPSRWPMLVAAVGGATLLAMSAMLARAADPSPDPGTSGPPLPAAVLEVLAALTSEDADPAALAERELAQRTADREALGLAAIDPGLPAVMAELDRIGAEQLARYAETLEPPGPGVAPSPVALAARIGGSPVRRVGSPAQPAGLSLVWGMGYTTALALIDAWRPGPGTATTPSEPYHGSGTTSVAGRTVPYEVEIDTVASIDAGRITVTTAFTMRSSASDGASGQSVSQIEDHGRFSVSVNPCPFAGGQVISTAEAVSDESVNGAARGYTIHNEATATGITTVDEGAQVAGTTLEVSARRTTSGEHDSDVGYTASIAPEAPIEATATRTEGTEADSLALAKGAGVVVQASIAGIVDAARDVWQGGRCLDLVTVPAGTTVDHGSQTPIRVTVRQVVEDAELPLPVEATLEGTESIDPADQPQDAPADFTYTATSEEEGGGTVTFRSVSNRGIAERSETFQVAEPRVATGVIQFQYGYRIEDPDHVPTSPAWTLLQVTGVMQLRMERRGGEWTDAGSTYTLVAIETMAPFWGSSECEIINRIAGAERSGPLRRGDDIRLVVNSADGSGELHLSMGTVPGTAGWNASFRGDCDTSGGLTPGVSYPTTMDDEAGWGVGIDCNEGTLDGQAAIIRFDCEPRVTIAQMAHGVTQLFATSLQGRVRLTP